MLDHEWIKLAQDDDSEDSENEAIDIETAQNLLHCLNMSHFQGSVISFLVGLKSNKADLDKLGKIFKQLDANNDGHLSKDEMESGMQ